MNIYLIFSANPIFVVTMTSISSFEANKFKMLWDTLPKSVVIFLTLQ